MDRRNIFASQVFEYLLGHCKGRAKMVEKAAKETLGARKGGTIMARVNHYKYDEAVADMLLQQFQVKFGQPSAGVRERVRAASARQRHAWVKAVVSATSLDEVFAGDGKR